MRARGAPVSQPRLKPFIEELFREALSAVDPERLVREAIDLHHNAVLVRGIPHRLERHGRLVVLALGKAAVPMARGALSVLGDRVHRCVVVPKSDGADDAELGLCHVVPGSHPLPDARSLHAGQALLEAVQGLSRDDLVLVLLSGGGSALAEVPRTPLDLNDVVRTTECLLKAGADIWLLNGVRRRLSELKGGGLARAAAPARIINLIVSDVLGSPLSVIASGPTVEPEPTSEDIARTVKQLGVWFDLPEVVRTTLETPERSTLRLGNVLQSVVLADAAVLAHAAIEACRVRGLPAVVCGTRYTGEASQFGRFWATLARSVREERVPWAPPVALVAAGELTVTVRGGGRGGRNTEMALAAALTLAGARDITIASLASDGDDGTSGAAGAVVDTATIDALRDLGLDARDALQRNDSATVLAAVGSLVVTGLTGTNVNDLYVAIVD